MANNALALLAKSANRAAGGVRSAAGKGAALARGGVAAGKAIAKDPGGSAKKATKYIWSATKEPLGSAAAREGVSLAGHGGAYTLDSIFKWRAWGGWLRPSFFLGAVSFVLAALTGGKWRVVFRNSGQGVLHHYFARGLDIVHGYLAPGSPSGTAGAESQDQGGSPGY